MSKKVVENLSQNADTVKKEVESIMGGKVLEYEAKTILKEGIAQGVEQGVEQGIEASIKKLADNYVKTGAAPNEEEAIYKGIHHGCPSFITSPSHPVPSSTARPSSGTAVRSDP